ncbi:hypothetical protein HYX19_05015, partial [Candidatus Woesearchaeota archaeon]|nr:hypothetical protein [Candidatus Woesearchaeota archaeon]
DFNYLFPREGKVARFYAYSGRAFLDCGGYPRGSNYEFGVRVAKIFS